MTVLSYQQLLKKQNAAAALCTRLVCKKKKTASQQVIASQGTPFSRNHFINGKLPTAAAESSSSKLTFLQWFSYLPCATNKRKNNLHHPPLFTFMPPLPYFGYFDHVMKDHILNLNRPIIPTQRATTQASWITSDHVARRCQNQWRRRKKSGGDGFQAAKIT